MALDRAGNTIAAGQVYGLAGTVRLIDGDVITVVIGLAGYEQVVRVHAGDVVPVGTGTIDNTDWGGALVGSGITTAQALADWLDANLGGI